MAIVKGIEPGAILLKYKKVQPGYAYNPETGRNEYQENIEHYYVLKLETRRARTNGAYLEGNWYKPFLEAIKVRINQRRHDVERAAFVAVGAWEFRCRNKEEWDNYEIDEVAQRHYQRKVNNSTLTVMLEKPRMYFTDEQLAQLKSIQDDPTPAEEIVWPEEPRPERFPRYDIEGVGGRRLYG